MQKLIVYVDGFNLYYGALKDTPYRWLDLLRFCRVMFPRYEVVAVKYFTARITDMHNDPSKSQRQQVYLRALATFDRVEIIYGHFLSGKKTLRLADAQKRKFARVLYSEEKGSDVNLATHLLHDAHLRRFDIAAVITNDTDFLTPIRLVQEHFNLPVGVLCPREHMSRTLKQSATFTKKIRAGALRACQLPDVLRDGKGEIHKPHKF